MMIYTVLSLLYSSYIYTCDYSTQSIGPVTRIASDRDLRPCLTVLPSTQAHVYMHIYNRDLLAAWRFQKATRSGGEDRDRTSPKVLRRGLFDGARAHGGRRWSKGWKGS